MPHLLVVVHLGQLTILDVFTPTSIFETLFNTCAEPVYILQCLLYFRSFPSAFRSTLNGFLEVVSNEGYVVGSMHVNNMFCADCSAVNNQCRAKKLTELSVRQDVSRSRPLHHVQPSCYAHIPCL